MATYGSYMIEQNARKDKELDSLRAVNAELLEALRGVLLFEWAPSDVCPPGAQVRYIGRVAADKARAAIARAEAVVKENAGS